MVTDSMLFLVKILYKFKITMPWTFPSLRIGVLFFCHRFSIPCQIPPFLSRAKFRNYSFGVFLYFLVLIVTTSIGLSWLVCLGGPDRFRVWEFKRGYFFWLFLELCWLRTPPLSLGWLGLSRAGVLERWSISLLI